ncbi:hypothetical protein ABVT39_014440 [Epinephelus coioides]
MMKMHYSTGEVLNMFMEPHLEPMEHDAVSSNSDTETAEEDEEYLPWAGSSSTSSIDLFGRGEGPGLQDDQTDDEDGSRCAQGGLEWRHPLPAVLTLPISGRNIKGKIHPKITSSPGDDIGFPTVMMSIKRKSPKSLYRFGKFKANSFVGHNQGYADVTPLVQLIERNDTL